MTSLVAFVSLLAPSVAPPDIAALRALARVPAVRTEVNFSISDEKLKALKKRRLVSLEAARPRGGRALLDLASLKGEVEGHDAAKEAYARAAKRLEEERSAGKPETEALHAYALLRMGREEEASALVRRLVREQPASGIAWAVLVDVLDVDGRAIVKKTGGFEFKWGRDATPEDAARLARLLRDHRSTVEGYVAKLREAAEAADKAVSLSPQDPFVYERRLSVAMQEAVLRPALEAALAGTEVDTKAVVGFYRIAADKAREIARLQSTLDARLQSVLLNTIVAFAEVQQQGTEFEAVPGMRREVKMMLPQPLREAIRPELETMVREIQGLSRAEGSDLLREMVPTFFLVGEPRRAAEVAVLAVAAAPGDEKAALLHLNVLLGLEEGAKEAAKVGALYAARIDSVAIRHRLVKALDLDGRPEDVSREVQKTLARWPQDIFSRLARIALELRRPGSDATFRANLTQVREIVANRPSDKGLRHDAELLLALHLGIAGQAEEAREILEKLIKEGDEDTQQEANSALSALKL